MSLICIVITLNIYQQAATRIQWENIQSGIANRKHYKVFWIYFQLEIG